MTWRPFDQRYFHWLAVKNALGTLNPAGQEMLEKLSRKREKCFPPSAKEIEAQEQGRAIMETLLMACGWTIADESTSGAWKIKED